jgi:hypothetical protein
MEGCVIQGGEITFADGTYSPADGRRKPDYYEKKIGAAAARGGGYPDYFAKVAYFPEIF